MSSRLSSQWQLIHLGTWCSVTYCWYQWKNKYKSKHCKSKYTIYLMECTKCKLQYVGKAETELNLRIKNDCKDVRKLNAIPADQHFSSCFFEIWALCVSWITYNHLYYVPCLTCCALFGSLVPGICNCTSCAQEHELPQSPCGDNREDILLSWLHIYYYLYCSLTLSEKTKNAVNKTVNHFQNVSEKKAKIQ